MSIPLRLDAVVPRVNINPNSVDADITLVVAGNSVEFCSLDIWGTHSATIDRLTDGLHIAELDGVCHKELSTDYIESTMAAAGIRIITYSPALEVIGFLFATYVTGYYCIQYHLVCSKMKGVGGLMIQTLHEFASYMQANGNVVKAIILESVLSKIRFHERQGYSFGDIIGNTYRKLVDIPDMDFNFDNVLALPPKEAGKFNLFFTRVAENQFLKGGNESFEKLLKRNGNDVASAVAQYLRDIDDVLFLMATSGPFNGVLFTNADIPYNRLKTQIDAPMRGKAYVKETAAWLIEHTHVGTPHRPSIGSDQAVAAMVATMSPATLATMPLNSALDPARLVPRGKGRKPAEKGRYTKQISGVPQTPHKIPEAAAAASPTDDTTDMSFDALMKMFDPTAFGFDLAFVGEENVLTPDKLGSVKGTGSSPLRDLGQGQLFTGGAAKFGVDTASLPRARGVKRPLE